MQQNSLIGAVLVVVGLLDAATALWLPQRIQDERQRTVLRIAFLASGALIVTLGGLFLAGVMG